MSTPFTWFLIVMLSVALLLWLFLRDAVNNIKNVIAEHAKVYFVAYVKGGGLIALAMIAGFKEAFQPVTAAMADKFEWWDWAIKFSAPLAGGIAVLVAFLDQSKARADAVKEERIKEGLSAAPFPIKTDTPATT